ncbi:MAG: HDOD domain-containing protein [Gammaproteobacteria bacterium]|nr:HDOD domain-containing protein [Gammaproteobacteria bacterium]
MNGELPGSQAPAETPRRSPRQGLAAAFDSTGNFRARRLPTIGDFAAQLMAEMRDPDISDLRVLQLLKQDVALSSNVLAVANSPFYGLSRQVESLHQALRVLGFEALRNLIYAATLRRLFKQGRLCERFDARCLWMHARTTAAVARRLALHVPGVDPQRAFLGGLLHDVGHIVMIQLDRQGFCDVVTAVSHEPDGYLASERAHLGMDHAQVGAAALRTWKFPDWTVSLVAGHHEAQFSDDASGLLARIIALADQLSGRLPGSFAADLAPANPLDMHALGLDPSVGDDILALATQECAAE